MKFLKEQGYGGVIIWSLDLDDKVGDACKEGPFPLINAVKRELLNVPKSSTTTTTEKSERENSYTISTKTVRLRSMAHKRTVESFLLFFSLILIKNLCH